MKRVARLILAAAVAAAPLSAVPVAFAADAPAAVAADPAAQAKATIDKGLGFLKSKQGADGGWQTQKEYPALTALVLKAFVQADGYNTKTDFVKRGYDKLLGYQLETGGIYQDSLANYNTAIAVSALAAANDPAFKERIDRAATYLKRLQWAGNGEKGPGGEVVADAKNPWYGGWGYGRPGRTRPDLSNAHFAIEALKDAGLRDDDPAFKAAVTFVSRIQNNSETNDQKYAADDGGFIYTVGPQNEGGSEAGEYQGPDGKRLWRSYGSMTYAGLKSMIYAGVKKDDPRVKAAMDWIRKNWTLDANPGMQLNNPAQAKNGLYYYYHVFGKALNAYDEPVITDAKGERHDWRVELVQKIAAQQKPDGSWAGDARFMESDPLLATSFAVLALEEAVKDLKEHPPR